MKKILVSLLLVAASLNAIATDFAVATLTLKGNTSLEQGEVTLVKTDDPAASSFCAPLFIDQYHVVMYAISGGDEKYQIWANADLKDFPLGIKTYSDAEYTITVSNVSGSETLNLYDAVTGQSIPLTDGQTYVFSAAANSTIADRFIINKSTPAGPSICFNYNKLQINGHAGEALIIKKGAEEIANVPALPAIYELDLNAQSGRLVVTLDGVDYQIDANPAVTVL